MDDDKDSIEATEFDENGLEVSGIADVEYDYDDEDYEDNSGRSVPLTPLGQFLNRINTFKANIKSELDLLSRNIRLAFAFLSVG